jgi:hypothetical protein
MSGQDNTIYVRLKNIGSARAYGFSIRVYVSHFAGMEFVYPHDFIPTPNAGSATPLAAGTYLVGEVKVSGLDAGAVDIRNVTWPAALVPPDTAVVNGSAVPWHPCLLVEVSPTTVPRRASMSGRATTSPSGTSPFSILRPVAPSLWPR